MHIVHKLTFMDNTYKMCDFIPKMKKNYDLTGNKLKYDNKICVKDFYP